MHPRPRQVEGAVFHTECQIQKQFENIGSLSVLRYRRVNKRFYSDGAAHRTAGLRSCAIPSIGKGILCTLFVSSVQFLHL